MKSTTLAAGIFVLCTLGALSASANPASQYEIVEALDIAKVPSDFPVGFSLLSAPPHQFAAYYDSERRMTIASRLLNAADWQYQILPSTVGWDSHNYITMAVDNAGHLHVSGNMHVSKLVYFRTQTPGDITTLRQLPMTGQEETRVTYPKFLTSNEGVLIFNYRSGSSGNGARIYNKYDLESETWTRLLDKPLLDGEGVRNAYPKGPVHGPDGRFHMIWVWRDTPDCATNNNLSYARSDDLIHWESIAGEHAPLPLTLGNASLIVDPIPSGGGIINGCEKLTFDESYRPLISYHKADKNGHMQIYVARFETDQWVHHKITDWNRPVHFGGNGSMGFIGIKISTHTRPMPDLLTLTYRHQDYGSGRVVVAATTLRPVQKEIDVTPEFPREMERRRIDGDGIGIKRAYDSGATSAPGIRYMLQWETLGPAHDRRRDPPLPEPSTLTLYKLRQID